MGTWIRYLMFDEFDCNYFSLKVDQEDLHLKDIITYFGNVNDLKEEQDKMLSYSEHNMRNMSRKSTANSKSFVGILENEENIALTQNNTKTDENEKTSKGNESDNVKELVSNDGNLINTDQFTNIDDLTLFDKTTPPPNPDSLTHTQDLTQYTESSLRTQFSGKSLKKLKNKNNKGGGKNLMNTGTTKILMYNTKLKDIMF